VLGDGKQWWAADFLEQAATYHENDFRKLLALLDHCVCNGMPTNEQKVRKLEGRFDDLLEFKAGCLRLFWFWDKGKVVICTHGIVKKSQATPQKDLKTANERRKAYLAAKKNNEIKILES
jgi:phage-related protein